MSAQLILAFAAGSLSILSPCVLPLLPIVLGTAASRSRLGPLALGSGVVLSFVSVGLFVALIGFSIGLDAGFFRVLASVMLIIIGLVLLVPVYQNRLAVAAGPVSSWGQKRLEGFSSTGATGQFVVGLLLGTVWSPCVGPTLGATSLLAAQGRDLIQVVSVMVSFGLGVGVPLVLIGMLSRGLLQKLRARMLTASKGLKAILGAIFILLGGLILTGLDKKAEAALVDASPAWLTELTTRF
ncbi:MAG: cytochrome c biogenesis CcdA family protein [Aestuariivirga sp.]